MSLRNRWYGGCSVSTRPEAAKLLHLIGTVVRHADVADLSLADQLVERLGRFLGRRTQVGPVNLIDINVIGSKVAQAGLGLPRVATAC